MLSLPRGMLDGEDDDFVSGHIDLLVNEVGIPPSDEFTALLYCLWSADLWKQNQILERMENSRARLLRSRRIVSADIVADGSEVLRSTRREPELHRSKRRNAASTSSSVANSRRCA